MAQEAWANPPNPKRASWRAPFLKEAVARTGSVPMHSLQKSRTQSYTRAFAHLFAVRVDCRARDGIDTPPSAHSGDSSAQMAAQGGSMADRNHCAPRAAQRGSNAGRRCHPPRAAAPSSQLHFRSYGSLANTFRELGPPNWDLHAAIFHALRSRSSREANAQPQGIMVSVW